MLSILKATAIASPALVPALATMDAVFNWKELS
jgi:hypothetical protein